MTRKCNIVVAAWWVLSIIKGVYPQAGIIERERDRWALPSLAFQYWKIEDAKILQFCLPLTLIYPVNERLQVNVFMAPAHSSIQNGSSMSLSGLSDTRISGSYLFGSEKVLATFGVNLPSGKHALEVKETMVANTLSLRALDFQMPILGQGFEASLGVVGAQRFSGWVLGMGAGFLFRAPFAPIEHAQEKYNPGEEFTVSLGLDHPMRKQKKLMFDLSYTFYTADKIEDKDVFKSGNRFTAQAMAYLPTERIKWLVKIKDRIRGKNEMGYGELIPERQNSNGNELELSLLATIPYAPPLNLRGAVEAKFYSDNAYDIGGAKVVGGGFGISQKLSAMLWFDFDARLYFGSLNYGFDEAALFGFRAYTGLRLVL